MRILVDENIPRMTVGALRETGHDVEDIRGTSLQGMTDEDLLCLAQREQRLLITTDKGFARHRDHAHYGLLIICLRQPNRQRIHERVLQAMNLSAEKDWPGQVVTVRDQVQSIWRTTVAGQNDA